jgi:hypothetical protein
MIWAKFKHVQWLEYDVCYTWLRGYRIYIHLFQKTLSGPGERRMAVVERRLHDRKELWLLYLVCKM